MKQRDKGRSALMSSSLKRFRKQLVTVEDRTGEAPYSPVLDNDGQPVVVEVRQPTVKDRSAITRAAKAQSGDADKVDTGVLIAEAVIKLSFVPGTDERYFEDADRAALLEQPAGGFVDQVGQVALKLMNFGSDEVAEKNSAKTASEGSSSP